jgi:outer membrane protein
MFLSFSVVGVAAPADVNAVGKFGYVNIQTAIEKTKEGITAKRQYENFLKKRQEEIKKMEGDIKKMNDDFEKKQAVLSEAVRGQKQEELQKEMVKYSQFAQRSQMEAAQKERELLQPIFAKIRETVESVAKKEGYDLVVENALYANPNVDITEKVISAYEKDSKVKK